MLKVIIGTSYYNTNNWTSHNTCKEGTMEILSHIGALLFIILWGLSILLNVFQPKWYWENFIPKLHKKEEKHPVITVITLLFVVIIMLYGVMSVITR